MHVSCNVHLLTDEPPFSWIRMITINDALIQPNDKHKVKRSNDFFPEDFISVCGQNFDKISYGSQVKRSWQILININAMNYKHLSLISLNTTVNPSISYVLK